MHGPDVLALQHLLEQRGYLAANLDDGEYGPVTAQAVYRAKYWLGYRSPDHSAGPMLVSYLKRERKPTLLMARRTLLRRRKRKDKPLRLKALSRLKTHIGEKEHPPGSNRMPWATGWYGLVGPWCAMAVSHAYVEAGSKAFRQGRRYAYVPYIVEDARAGRNNLALTHLPMPGDIVCYDWDGDHRADHTGLFDGWIAGAEGSEFNAIEANTGVGNDSNGGEVMSRQRKISQVQAFVHVGA